VIESHPSGYAAFTGVREFNEFACILQSIDADAGAHSDFQAF
jgi:hypothetical protein